MEPPFLSEQHPLSRRRAIFEDDGVSVWLYLTDPGETAPSGDCWIHNSVPTPEPSEIESFLPAPPPAAKGHAGPQARWIDPDGSGMRLLWTPDGDGVAILVDGRPLGFLVAGESRGTSRNLVKDGPWGHTWDQARYDSLFAGGGVASTG